MPQIKKYPANTFCYPELATTDTAGAKKFYAALFGWDMKSEEIGPDMVYTMGTQKGKNVSGMWEINDEMKKMGIPTHWLQYVSVDSVADMTKKAVGLGAKVMREPMDVMDIGKMSVLQDPTGAVFALWQPLTTIGSELINEHGAITWNELMTNDVDKAGKFYTDLFGWTAGTQDMGGFMYTGFMNGERPAGGMMAITKEMGPMPPNWNQYFAVDDCDKTVDKAKSMGAHVLAGPQDIPEIGRFAVLMDPQGGAFSVITLLNPADAPE